LDVNKLILWERLKKIQDKKVPSVCSQKESRP
jgi:hypothetical protein